MSVLAANDMGALAVGMFGSIIALLIAAGGWMIATRNARLQASAEVKATAITTKVTEQSVILDSFAKLNDSLHRQVERLEDMLRSTQERLVRAEHEVEVTKKAAADCLRQSELDRKKSEADLETERLRSQREMGALAQQLVQLEARYTALLEAQNAMKRG